MNRQFPTARETTGGLHLYVVLSTTRWVTHWQQTNPTEPHPALLNIAVNAGTQGSGHPGTNDKTYYWTLLAIDVPPSTTQTPDALRSALKTWTQNALAASVQVLTLPAGQTRRLLALGEIDSEALAVEAALIAPPASTILSAVPVYLNPDAQHTGTGLLELLMRTLRSRLPQPSKFM
jgi:hypothetical protein